MRLYDYFRSSAAYRVRIVLNIKGLAYESVPKHLRKAEHRTAQFVAMNPSGLVPVLDDAGLIISQSLAIIEYLEEKHPSPPILPRDAADRACVRSMALHVACDVHPLNNMRVLNFLRTRLGIDEASVNGTWYPHWVAEGLRALEEEAKRHTGDGLHMFGSGVTLADVVMVPQMYNAARFKCDLAPYPTLRGIRAHLEALPEFANAAPEVQPDAE